MNKRHTVLTGLLATGALVALPTAAAQAATTLCTGVLQNQTINGNLEVPPGAGCVLSHVTVTGNVKIDPGGALSLGTTVLPGGDTISGSLTGTNIQAFDSFEPQSTVGGALQLTGVTGVPKTGPLQPFINDDRNYLDHLTVNGPVSITHGSVTAGWRVVDSNFNSSFNYSGNAGNLFVDTVRVTGSMIIKANTGGGSVNKVTVGGSLSCGNAPPITFSNITTGGFNGASSGTC